MPNLPIRDLGSVGVITDVDPFNLPISAFTRAKNVRFDQGNVRRSPGFRDITNIGIQWAVSGNSTWLIADALFQTAANSAAEVALFETTQINGRPLGDITNTGDVATAADSIAIAYYLDWKIDGLSRNANLLDAHVLYIEDVFIPYMASNQSSYSTYYNINAWSPVFTHGLYNANGYDTVVIVSNDFDIHEYSNATLSLDFSSGAAASTAQVTATSLANVQYLNREDTAPIYRTPAMSNFASLVNWPSGFTCASLRSFGDFLIALNTDEGGSSFPTRVRFSNIALANNAPDSWDASDTTKSAGFNDLAQMDTPIIDGATLGSNFLIYSSDQVWLMEFVGGTFIFNFRKLFSDSGVINQNCVVEVEGKHYVFDQKDIYVTDGVSRQSIVDGRVKDYIFSGIDTSAYNKCFVQYDQSREEIYFCYKSSDDMAEFTNGDGCNRAAVFNYRSNTWSFMDLPNVFAGTSANVNSVATYDSTSLTYDAAGGTYASQDAGFDRHILMLGQAASTDGLTNAKLYGLDGINENSALSQALNTAATKGIKLERVGIDLDEAQMPLTGYKAIRKMVPQFSTVASNKVFDVSMGAADLPNEVPTFETTVNFNSDTQYKIDSRSSGRYLSYKVETTDVKDFTISGFDFDVVATGRR